LIAQKIAVLKVIVEENIQSQTRNNANHTNQSHGINKDKL
jgi:hypothetical protein